KSSRARARLSFARRWASRGAGLRAALGFARRWASRGAGLREALDFARRWPGTKGRRWAETRAERSAAGVRRSSGQQTDAGEGGLVALAFHALALQLAEAAHGLGALAGLLFRRLLEMPAELHLAEYALALHLLLQRPKGLVDVIVANDNLHG